MQKEIALTVILESSEDKNKYEIESELFYSFKSTERGQEFANIVGKEIQELLARKYELEATVKLDYVSKGSIYLEFVVTVYVVYEGISKYKNFCDSLGLFKKQVQSLVVKTIENIPLPIKVRIEAEIEAIESGTNIDLLRRAFIATTVLASILVLSLTAFMVANIVEAVNK